MTAYLCEAIHHRNHSKTDFELQLRSVLAYGKVSFHSYVLLATLRAYLPQLMDGQSAHCLGCGMLWHIAIQVRLALDHAFHFRPAHYH